MTSARNAPAPGPAVPPKSRWSSASARSSDSVPVTGNRARIGGGEKSGGSARSGQGSGPCGPGSSLPRVAVEPVEDGQPGLCCEAGGERAAHPVRFGSKPHTALTPGSGLPGREALGMKTLAQPPQAGPQLGRSAEPALPRPRVRRSATVENFRPARQAGSGPGRE